MKKIYQTPTTLIVKVKATRMMAGSEKMGFGDNVTSASSAESRGGGWGSGSRSLWDDDDYDE